MEDQADWFEIARFKLAELPNGMVFFAPDEKGYVHGIDAAVTRVRTGGLLVVDNTDWHWFANVAGHVPAEWHKTVIKGCAPFIGYPSQTTIWQKPEQ